MPKYGPTTAGKHCINHCEGKHRNTTNGNGLFQNVQGSNKIFYCKDCETKHHWVGSLADGQIALDIYTTNDHQATPVESGHDYYWVSTGTKLHPNRSS